MAVIVHNSSKGFECVEPLTRTSNGEKGLLERRMLNKHFMCRVGSGSRVVKRVHSPITFLPGIVRQLERITLNQNFKDSPQLPQIFKGKGYWDHHYRLYHRYQYERTLELLAR